MNETMQNVLERNIKIYKKSTPLNKFLLLLALSPMGNFVNNYYKKRLRMFSIRISAVEAPL